MTTRSKEWTVVVRRDGKDIMLKPKQLVLATGQSGKANMPNFKGMETFKGDQHHSSKHPGPRCLCRQEGRRHRLQQFRPRHRAALWEAGADVTMVQRSTTHIVKSDTLMEIGLGSLYSEKAVASGMTTAKADLVFASLPYKILHEFQIPAYAEIRSATPTSTRAWRRPASCSTGAMTSPACS